jgi:hypothetical protein
VSPRRDRLIRWRCDKCSECVATVENGWWRPTTDASGESQRARKREALRFGHYEDKAIFDPEDRQHFLDVAPPKQLAPRRLAGLPRDGVICGLCPRHGIRTVQLADVRHKLAR